MSSYLRFVPASSAAVTINWDKVPEASKKFLLKVWGYDWNTEETRSLPPTIGGLAKMLDESRFLGYMDHHRVTLLLDISEFGLVPTSNARGVLPVGPRFYMKYQSNVWVVLFMPGSRDGITAYGPEMPTYLDYDDDEETQDGEAAEGCSPEMHTEFNDDDKERGAEEDHGPDMQTNFDDNYEDREAAEDRALAEDFDPKLCDAVNQFGELEILVNGKIAGWSGSMLSSDLEQAQLLAAMMTLPRDHSARIGMIQRGIQAFKNAE